MLSWHTVTLSIALKSISSNCFCCCRPFYQIKSNKQKSSHWFTIVKDSKGFKLPKSHFMISVQIKNLNKHPTRAAVYETLCLQHMLTLNNSLEIVPNLQRAITPKIIDGICWKVNQSTHHPLSADQVSSPCSDSFQDILLTSFKCQNLQRAITLETNWWNVFKS